jgi:O-antigen ligase
VQAVVVGPPGRVLLAAAPYALALLVLLLVVRIHRRDVGPERILAAVAAGGAALAVWLLVGFARALPDGIGAEHGFYRVKLAVTSPLGDHNTAAGLLLVGLVASVLLVTSRPNVVGRRWWTDVRWRTWVPSVLVVLALVVTMSRGAVAVLLVVTVAAWVVAGDRRLAVGLSAATVVVVAGLVALSVTLDTSPPPPSTGIGGPLAEAGAGPIGVSILGRADLAIRGAELGAAHPLLGVGLGGFAEHASDLPRPNDHAHQALAHAVAEGGVVLLLVTAGLPLLLAWRAWQLSASPVRDLALVGGGALVAHAQVEILAGRVGYEVLLGVLLGLVAAAGEIDSRRRALPATAPPPTTPGPA